MFIVKSALLFIVILNFVAPQGCRFLLKATNIECFPNPEFVSNHTCRLKAQSRYRTMVGMECYLLKPLRNVSLNIGIYKRNHANIFQPFLVNFTINGCEVLSRKKNSLYADIVKNLLQRFSNLNHSCPISGAVIVRNAYVYDELYNLPLSPPLGYYKASFRYMEGYPYQEAGWVYLYGELMENRSNAHNRGK